MATVTGLTADRMLEIEAASVVDGEVNGSGHLILTTHDGDFIDAGNVIGPPGTPGTPGTPGAPGTPGVDAAPGDVNPTAGTTPIRTSPGGRVKGGTATAVDDLTTKAQMDAAVGTNTTAIATLSALVVGTEIGNAVNLNSLTASGLYVQTSDAEAAAGTNYPVAVGGTLEVMANAALGLIVQTYQAFSDSGTVVYRRTYTGTWSAWAKFTAKVPAMPAATATTSTGTATSGATETRDAVMGNYVFTAIGSHSYRAVLDNAAAVCTVAADQFAVRIRNGGASTPTASSTVVANARVVVTNTGVALPVALSGKFTPGAGVQTLSVFMARVGSGTGTGQVWGADLARALYVIDLGD